MWNQYTDSKGVKFVHEMKNKYKDKNDTKCNNYTPHMPYRDTQSMTIMHTDCWVTHNPKSQQELTVDVTSPNKCNIYPCDTMNHDIIKCLVLNSTTRKTQTNTCIPKM